MKQLSFIFMIFFYGCSLFSTKDKSIRIEEMILKIQTYNDSLNTNNIDYIRYDYYETYDYFVSFIFTINAKESQSSLLRKYNFNTNEINEVEISDNIFNEVKAKIDCIEPPKDSTKTYFTLSHGERVFVEMKLGQYKNNFYFHIGDSYYNECNKSMKDFIEYKIYYMNFRNF